MENRLEEIDLTHPNNITMTVEQARERKLKKIK